MTSFSEFVARVGPERSACVEGLVPCRTCGSPFATQLFLGVGHELTPVAIMEPRTRTCPRCELAAEQVKAHAAGA